MDLADKVRILYVGKDTPQSKTVKRILEEAYKFQVEVAQTYNEAIARIEKTQQAGLQYDAYIIGKGILWGEGETPPKTTLAETELVKFLRIAKGYTVPITITSSSDIRETIERQLIEEGITDIIYENSPITHWGEYCRMLKAKIAENKPPKLVESGRTIIDSFGKPVLVTGDYLDGT